MQLKEIENIHRKKKAIFNKLYVEDSGKIYIGTVDNRLKLLTSTSEVVISSTITLEDILITTGDGTKFLSDDGTYKVSSGGISNGDKGDITVSDSGSTFTIDNGVVTDVKLASGITASKITQTSSYRFVTDIEKATWNNKQDALVSGTNIKTINSNSLLGTGNIIISEGLTQQQVEGLI